MASSTTKVVLDSERHAPLFDDERLARVGFLTRMFRRPEMGALTVAVALFIFFLIVAPVILTPDAVATVLYGSATVGVMAVPVSLLMIGGEFDLSAGVGVFTIAIFSALSTSMFAANVWFGALIGLVFALLLGFVNGLLLVKTKLSSFIITLGTFFALQGVNLGVTRLVTGGVATPDISQSPGYGVAHALFGSNIPVFGMQISVLVFYWIALVLIGTWVLVKTRVGNWIFAVGGAPDAARAVGVPVAATKIGLFMAVGFCGWIMGMAQLFTYNVIQSGQGPGNELLYIVAVVVGGCLLTGGYGSVVGGAIGALIYGMSVKGVVYAEWPPDWMLTFLGVLLLAATVLNFTMSRRAAGSRGAK